MSAQPPNSTPAKETPMDHVHKVGVACTLEVIRTTLAQRGDGKEEPFRFITQYWSRDGVLLAERDPHAETERKQRNEYIEILKESEQLATTEKRRTRELLEKSRKEVQSLQEKNDQIRVNRPMRLETGFGFIPPGKYILKPVDRKKR